ncbi:MAG: mandelate racemase/muconate lactonizing enzyme family protein, partial [Anaerolineae bacterium]|nr:mandelate racemase/muconate lactonizing enzyme family protein [Anaerolineae bacterium]
MKITDVKCAVIGQNPTVRIETDEGLYGYGQAEATKPYLKPHVLFYKKWLLGMDPTDVERCMMGIRRMGSFKPWGSAVSAIEIALWDIAGKAAGVPVYKLLGGKVRDKVRVYNGGVRFPMNGSNPEDYANNVAQMKASPEGFSFVKMGVGFHSRMPSQVPDLFYGEVQSGASHPNRGLLTEKGLKHIIACVEAMKDVLGDEVGLALDCGPGWVPTDVVKFA